VIDKKESKMNSFLMKQQVRSQVKKGQSIFWLSDNSVTHLLSICSKLEDDSGRLKKRTEEIVWKLELGFQIYHISFYHLQM